MLDWSIGSACSGIGGLDLGLERAGLGAVAWQCEVDPFCREVLDLHWPGLPRYADVRTCEPPRVDLLCAGFPCQPVSVAGRRRAQEDERWLWPSIARLIDVCEPKVVIVENVPGLRTAGLRDVLADLAARGFDAEWAHFRASDLGAPHKRDRFWLAASHPDRVQLRKQPGWLGRACRAGFAPEPRRVPPDAASPRRQPRSRSAGSESERTPGQPGLLPADSDRVRRFQRAVALAEERGWVEHCGWSLDQAAGVDDGLSGRLGAARKALGNSVVVPCVELVGRALRAAVIGPLDVQGL